MAGVTTSAWGLQALLGGGLVLLVAWGLMNWTRQPARRQRLGEWGVVAALLLAVLSLGPGWYMVPLPAAPVGPELARAGGEMNLQDEQERITPDRAGAETDPETPEPPDSGASPGQGGGCAPAAAREEAALRKPCGVGEPWPSLPAVEPPDEDGILPEAGAPAPAETPASAPAAVPETGWGAGPWLGAWLQTAYLGGAALLLLHWLLGHLALWRWLRRTEPAPPRAAALFEQLTAGRKNVKLLVSRKVAVPFSCGLVRPVVVLPAGLAEGGCEAALRWVLAHELAHLERRDAWACLLFGLGRLVYFPLPWFWWLRRQVSLCQEYIADAAAVEAAGRPEDYAQFLLGWVSPQTLPAGVTGVLGRSSDLFRRISMLLQSKAPVERSCPRHWSVIMAAGLLALAAIGAGVRLQASAASGADLTFKDDLKKEALAPRETAEDEESADDQKDKEKDKDKNKDKKDSTGRRYRTNQVPKIELDFDIEKLMKQLGDNLDPATAKRVQEQVRREMERARQQMERARSEVERAMEKAHVEVEKALEKSKEEVARKSRVAREKVRAMGTTESSSSDRPRLGVQAEPIGDALRDQFDLPKGQGLIIEEVVPDSPASRAGVKPHDVLLEINGKPVPADVGGLLRMLGEVKAGSSVNLVVLRKGRKETIRGVTLTPEGRSGRTSSRESSPNPTPAPDRRGRGASERAGEAPRPPQPPAAPGGGTNPPIPPTPPGAGGGRGGFGGSGGGSGGSGGFGGRGGFPGMEFFNEFQGRGGVMTTNFRTDDRFTTRHQEGSLIITLTGKVSDGKASLGEIRVQDGRESHRYTSVDKVPEEYRDKVRNLVEMNTKGSVRIEIKTP